MLWWDDLKYDLDRVFNKKSYFNILGYDKKLTPKEIEVITSLYRSPENFSKILLEIKAMFEETRLRYNDLHKAVGWYGWAVEGESLPKTALNKTQEHFKSQIKPLIKPLEDSLKLFKLEYGKLTRITNDIIKLTHEEGTELILSLKSSLYGSNSFKDYIKDFEKTIAEAKGMSSLYSN